MVQIRNMPEEIHRTVKARAAQAGMSLSEYLLREIRKSAERPTMEELVAQLASLPPFRPSKSSAEMVREAREERMRELDRRADSRRRRR